MKINRFALLFFCAWIMACQSSFGQLNPRVSGIIAGFQKELSADVAADNLHGSIAIALIKNNRVIWKGAVGYARHEQNILADSSNIYRIGSITKTFTATLLMQLVEEGKIKLDDPVEPYVPEIKKLKGYSDDIKITFRQLASHTAGLNREPDMSGADDGPTNKWESKLISCIPHTGFNSKPGEQFLYSNMGFAILGMALERVTNIPYIQMVTDRIFVPLHMNDTFFYLPDDKRSRLAEGMSNNNRGGNKVNTKLPVSEIDGRGYRVPNGGIFSTPADLSKFVISVMERPHLLKPENLRTMLEIPPGGKNYGLGMMIMHHQQMEAIGHNGSVPGYTSQFAIAPNSGYAVILMRNYNFGSTNLESAALDLLKKL